MTPANQINAWNTAAPHDPFSADGDSAHGDSAGAPADHAPDPAGAPEVPHAVAGAGLFFDVMPQRSEYLLTLGCCQGVTSDAIGCGVNTQVPCWSLFCVNTLTLT